MVKFILYCSDDEVIVTTPGLEEEAVKLFFTEGGRNIDEFDREESRHPGVQVTTRLRAE